jgi:hypothetical protein
MTITRAIPAADCDHRRRAALGGSSPPCGSARVRMQILTTATAASGPVVAAVACVGVLIYGLAKARAEVLRDNKG